MPNRRRRRPEQDEGRKDRKDARQRVEQSRVQRARIETQRDRREQRRDRRRSRRQQVDSVRSPKEDLRTERFESRLLPVEDSFLARPVGQPSELPVLIGERWARNSNITITNGVETTLPFQVSAFTTERNGYPALFNGTDTFRIPAGLAGIWRITCEIRWASNATNPRQTRILLNGTTYISDVQKHPSSANELSVVSTTVYNFQEADTFVIRVIQTSGGDLAITGTIYQTYVICEFIGK